VFITKGNFEFLNSCFESSLRFERNVIGNPPEKGGVSGPDGRWLSASRSKEWSVVVYKSDHTFIKQTLAMPKGLDSK
jgi:hypothetical protein